MIIIISVRDENGIRVYCLEKIRILYDLAQKDLHGKIQCVKVSDE